MMTPVLLPAQKPLFKVAFSVGAVLFCICAQLVEELAGLRRYE